MLLHLGIGNVPLSEMHRWSGIEVGWELSLRMERATQRVRRGDRARERDDPGRPLGRHCSSEDMASIIGILLREDSREDSGRHGQYGQA
jgi:hypothetical protein